MNYYALFYEVVEDYVARRSAYRDEHLRLAREAHRRGELLLAGALTEPADRALLIFRAPDRSVVEEFARNDPYVIKGLVTRWEVRSWAVVIGNETFDGLVREDQERKAREEIDRKLLEALDGSPATLWTREDLEELKRRVRERQPLDVRHQVKGG
jgi:uncharacterized protein YciI